VGKFNGQIYFKDMTGNVEALAESLNQGAGTLPRTMVAPNPSEVYWYRVR